MIETSVHNKKKSLDTIYNTLQIRSKITNKIIHVPLKNAKTTWNEIRRILYCLISVIIEY